MRSFSTHAIFDFEGLDRMGVGIMIKRTKILCAFAVFLFVGSLAATGVNAYVSMSASADKMIPAATYGDDRRNDAVSILVYSEVADTLSGGEWDNTMGSLIASLEGRFTYENLTDYTQLGSMIDEFDVLLILESEFGNYSFSDTVNAAWAGILPSYVDDGGIVVCMNGGPTLSELGSSARIINGTLLDVYNPELATAHQLDVNEVNDALARNVAASFIGQDATISFDVSQGNVVMEDNTDGKPVVVHRIMGKGHVVLLGFDLFVTENNVDFLLKNSILLHRHVVFDESHVQDYRIDSGFNALSENLGYVGLSVSSMDTFDTAILEASEILVISHCLAEYIPTEREIIEDFVRNGGGLFIITEWTTFGDGLDSLMNHFGYARNTTHHLEDSDDYYTNEYWMHLYPENLNMHSTKVGVDVVEVYGSTAIIDMPASAVPLLTTDDDGTTTWEGAEPANGIPIATAELLGNGRIVVLADNGPVSDADWDSDGTMNYMDADNFLFTNNIFRWLAGSGIPEQTVVFDQSHGGYGYVHASWNPLANFLMFNGYNVEWMNTFNPTAFQDADILVISDGSGDLPYNTTELTGIRDYVAGGGGLLLWGDNSAYSEDIDPIGQEFGLYVNTTGGSLHDTDDFEFDDRYMIYDGDKIGNHPIMDGVNRLEVDRSNAFYSISSGTALISTDDDGTATWDDATPAINLPVFAATEFDMGRVVFLTDVNFGTAGDPESDGFSTLYDSDNPIFAANVFKWLADNRAPSVEVISPNGGEVLNGTITINWDAVDFDSDPMTFDVYYSDNNGSSWSPLAAGLIVPELEWNTTQLDDDNSYMIRVEVSDGVLSSQDESDNPFTLENFDEPPPPPGTFDPTLLAIIGAGVLVVVIILVLVMKKKSGSKK